jgi:hypothetical protein
MLPSGGLMSEFGVLSGDLSQRLSLLHFYPYYCHFRTSYLLSNLPLPEGQAGADRVPS